MTTATTLSKIEVYWDAQDTRNEGWAYRVFRGEQEESGPLEDYAGCDLPGNAGAWALQGAVVDIAAAAGIEIEHGDVAYEHSDGGYAIWTA